MEAIVLVLVIITAIYNAIKSARTAAKPPAPPAPRPTPPTVMRPGAPKAAAPVKATTPSSAIRSGPLTPTSRLGGSALARPEPLQTSPMVRQAIPNLPTRDPSSADFAAKVKVLEDDEPTREPIEFSVQPEQPIGLVALQKRLAANQSPEAAALVGAIILSQVLERPRSKDPRR